MASNDPPSRNSDENWDEVPLLDRDASEVDPPSLAPLQRQQSGEPNPPRPDDRSHIDRPPSYLLTELEPEEAPLNFGAPLTLRGPPALPPRPDDRSGPPTLPAESEPEMAPARGSNASDELSPAGSELSDPWTKAREAGLRDPWAPDVDPWAPEPPARPSLISIRDPNVDYIVVTWKPELNTKKWVEEFVDPSDDGLDYLNNEDPAYWVQPGFSVHTPPPSTWEDHERTVVQYHPGLHDYVMPGVGEDTRPPPEIDSPPGPRPQWYGPRGAPGRLPPRAPGGGPDSEADLSETDYAPHTAQTDSTSAGGPPVGGLVDVASLDGTGYRRHRPPFKSGEGRGRGSNFQRSRTPLVPVKIRNYNKYLALAMCFAVLLMFREVIILPMIVIHMFTRRPDQRCSLQAYVLAFVWGPNSEYAIENCWYPEAEMFS